MNFRALALQRIVQAEARVRTAEGAVAEGNLPYAVRAAQEAVELALKAALGWVNVEYPKVHDVSDVLLRVADRFPESFRSRLPEFASVSQETARLRMAAMYGEELEGRGPGDLFSDPTFARTIVGRAEAVVVAVREWVR